MKELEGRMTRHEIIAMRCAAMKNGKTAESVLYDFHIDNVLYSDFSPSIGGKSGVFQKVKVSTS